MSASWFFDPLPVDSYDLVVIDPPWPFKTWSPLGQGKSPSKHYCTMPLADIMALPVRALLKNDAVVYLWATGAMLERAHEVMAAWGITYKTELLWRKVTASGKVRWGCGYWARSSGPRPQVALTRRSAVAKGAPDFSTLDRSLRCRVGSSQVSDLTETPA